MFFNIILLTNCSIIHLPTKEEITKLKKDAEEILILCVKTKDLEGLLKEAKSCFNEIFEMCFDNLSKKVFDSIYKEVYLWLVDNIQVKLKEIILYYKTNYPNNMEYKKFKNNAELYLKYFKVYKRKGRLFCFFVYFIIFMNGIGLSLAIQYFIKKK
ncbi:hypothetical protein TUBRATIS_12240 [Tubulinosema ratisbonensis]|uniref:Uncharacterized protein n=1 Tax=Tubulinosema ratisbonensis TaxID=291195 RepID=A0A437AMH3_9MICR|nr:hypothetical protein TUBRATIS_12240 [Tubulinosema ratisbonensis]